MARTSGIDASGRDFRQNARQESASFEGIVKRSAIGAGLERLLTNLQPKTRSGQCC